MNKLIEFIAKRKFPLWYAKKKGITFGVNCRLINVSYSTEPYLITLGDHVSVTYSHFETHDGGVWVLRDKYPEIDIVKPIKVGNNVFIGYGCIILPGTVIGNNVIIGARSVVSGNIPDNVVVAGVPARVIRSIDSYEERVIPHSCDTAKMSPLDKQHYYLKFYGK